MKKDKPSFKKKQFKPIMSKWCLKCGKVLKNPEITHCSDECLMADIKNSKTLDPDGLGAENWDEESKPWK